MRLMKNYHQTALLILAITISATAIADSSIYGSVRLSVRGQDLGDSLKWDIMNNASRLGLRASEELENGLKAVAHFEMGVAADTATFGGGTENRIAKVGLEGSFGGLYLGTQWSPFYSVVGGTTDLFNVVGAKHIHSTARLSDTLAYVNSFGPATLVAAVVIDDFSNETYNDEEMLDTIQIGAKFSIGPVVVGAAVDQRAKSSGDGIRLGLGATYKINEVTIAAEFTSTENTIENTKDDVNAIELYAGFGLGNGNLIHTSIGQSDYGTNTPKAISIGFQKKLSKRTKYWLEAMFEDSDTNDVEDSKTYAIGLRHDWK